MRESHYLGVSSQRAPVHGAGPDRHVFTRICKFDEKSYVARNKALRMFYRKIRRFSNMKTQDKHRPCKFSILAIFSFFSELEFTGPLGLRGTDP